MNTPRLAATRSAALIGAVILGLVAASCTDDGAWSAVPLRREEPVTTTLGDDTGQYAATITRTEDGVAHITGNSIEDVSFGQGWASGEDRACDLADQVVRVNGERARWFGAGEDDEHLNSDLAWRAIGIRDLAARDWEQADDETRGALTAYTDGWNAQLRAVGIDGITDWCRGAEWVRELEPVEVYAYARSIALLASSGAVAPMIATAEPPGAATEGTALASDSSDEPTTASNGWAIGSDRSEQGHGMLVAQPPLPVGGAAPVLGGPPDHPW